jgi:hypothetical protein
VNKKQQDPIEIKEQGPFEVKEVQKEELKSQIYNTIYITNSQYIEATQNNRNKFQICSQQLEK